MCLHSIPNTMSNSFPLLVHPFSSLSRKCVWTPCSKVPSPTTIAHSVQLQVKDYRAGLKYIYIGMESLRVHFVATAKGCTLVCTRYSIRLHVLQNTVIRHTVKKSISCHHVSFWLTADSKRQAKVRSAL